jgi:hypothetical protein
LEGSGDVMSNVCSPHQPTILYSHQPKGCGQLHLPWHARAITGSHFFDLNQTGIHQHKVQLLQALLPFDAEHQMCMF